MDLLSAARVATYAAGSTMAEHVHATASLCLVLTGDYEERTLGRREIEEAGTLLFCPANQPHAQRFGRRGATKLIVSPPAWALARVSAATHAPRTRGGACVALGRRIVGELRAQDEFSALAVEALSLELLATFARRTRTADRPAIVRRAQDYMSAHKGDRLSVAEVAAAIGCDPLPLSRAFRRAVGQSIGSFQRGLRIARVIALLDRRSMPLSEIALECGFCDQSHMTRAFKAQIGCTPDAYRRMC
ncbi:AraC family transcriptional regulator [Sphingomonas parva]|uniref:AraC family transcriptional regulator n=1 Tax=Sphingomonas parva TaxID=2555898 RepID=A0A4Y8ZL61_9SPHN|nr:AraC family transcriptional regulator [Sphingomonas parva]TFI56714.1 AraC family transcriptional regulator [Sphingomonas parva]